MSNNAEKGDMKENKLEVPFKRGGSRHKTTYNCLEGPKEESQYSQNDNKSARKLNKIMTMN